MDAATMSAAHTNVVEKYSAVKANIAKKKRERNKKRTYHSWREKTHKEAEEGNGGRRTG
jgi:hypothetical protein